MSAPVGHTPGPWHVMEGNYKKGGGRKFPVVYAAGEELKYIAYCDDQLYFYEPTDNLANARLIATAPELLEACESALMQLRVAVIANSGGLFDHDNVHEHLGVAKIMAAIDKARGKAPEASHVG